MEAFCFLEMQRAFLANYIKIKPKMRNPVALIIPLRGPFEEKDWRQSSIFVLIFFLFFLHGAKNKEGAWLFPPINIWKYACHVIPHFWLDCWHNSLQNSGISWRQVPLLVVGSDLNDITDKYLIPIHRIIISQKWFNNYVCSVEICTYILIY